MVEMTYAPARQAAQRSDAQQPGAAGCETMDSIGAIGSIGARWLVRMLDVVDYGMLMVEDGIRVAFANQLARAELAEQHPLYLVGSELRARGERDMATLRQALSGAACRGTQTMVTLTDPAGAGVVVSVVPLREPGSGAAVLLVFGKRRVCDDLSSDVFGRQHALTAAETRVLKLLCAGRRPRAIAAALGVTLNTVRTQISSIRFKTGSRDIGDVVHRVARLPPLACLVRRSA